MAFMASNDAIAPPGGLDVPTRRCEKCEAEMTHLSDLQPIIGSAAMRVFRCYVCNHVVSEQR